MVQARVWERDQARIKRYKAFCMSFYVDLSCYCYMHFYRSSLDSYIFLTFSVLFLAHIS